VHRLLYYTYVTGLEVVLGYTIALGLALRLGLAIAFSQTLDVLFTNYRWKTWF